MENYETYVWIYYGIYFLQFHYIKIKNILNINLIKTYTLNKFVAVENTPNFFMKKTMPSRLTINSI